MTRLDQFAASYREEAGERLLELEATLLELETRADDGDLVDRAFRALHTIKGSGAMFGFDDIASFTHELETVFDLVRNGKVKVTGDLVSLALEAKDLIRAMLDGTVGEGSGRERLVAAFRQHGSTSASPGRVEAPAPGASSDQPTAVKTYRIGFRPHLQLLQDGTNPLGLLAELCAMGACRVVALTGGVPPLEELSPEACHLAWDVTLTTSHSADDLRDVFIFVEDRCALDIEQVEEGEQVGLAVAGRTGAPAVVEQVVAAASTARSASGEPARPAPSTPTERTAGPVEAGASSPSSEVVSSIRVAAEKLDGLVDLVGELVICQARLTRIASRRDDPELLSISEDIERLSAALRDSTLDVRMVAIGTTFSRFKRLTRDLSTELGKQIELVTEGAETELDKTVIERLGDPLVHLIRNSCDHGIEAPEARRAAGKPERGTVRLSAYHSGAHVFIEIQDDGAGLDAAAIRAKAVERGLIEPEAKLPQKELWSLVFLPGFSTARQVSSVSGRGVGMDAVKRSIEALRGSVEVESARGAGTTIRIKLPLTLAIIEGLLVEVGEDSYVLPLSIVEECVELTSEDVTRAHGARLAAVRGELVPYLRLRELFGVTGERPAIEQIAITSVEGTRYGLVVDDVVGQHQTVIKSLGRMHRGVKGLSGATILGDGTVALIVDVPALLQTLVPTARAS